MSLNLILFYIYRTLQNFINIDEKLNSLLKNDLHT